MMTGLPGARNIRSNLNLVLKREKSLCHNQFILLNHGVQPLHRHVIVFSSRAGAPPRPRRGKIVLKGFQLELHPAATRRDSESDRRRRPLRFWQPGSCPDQAHLGLCHESCDSVFSDMPHALPVCTWPSFLHSCYEISSKFAICSVVQHIFSVLDGQHIFSVLDSLAEIKTISCDMTNETRLLEHEENQLKIFCRFSLKSQYANFVLSSA
jgi:hypothetical protein